MRAAGRGELLEPGDFVVCADEKPSIQARARKHKTLPAAPGDGQKVEHEYGSKGALCYLAAWDVRRAKIFDRCAPKDGIEPFDRLVEQFVSVAPYAKAQRVFLVVDNGSAHRGKRSIDRLHGAWLNLIVVHTPVHAVLAQPSRNLLLRCPAQGPLAQRLRGPRRPRRPPAGLRAPYERIATPFEWEFTRRDLERLLDRLDEAPEGRLERHTA
jgi:DDE superfamily endonuclease